MPSHLQGVVVLLATLSGSGCLQSVDSNGCRQYDALHGSSVSSRAISFAEPQAWNWLPTSRGLRHMLNLDSLPSITAVEFAAAFYMLWCLASLLITATGAIEISFDWLIDWVSCMALCCLYAGIITAASCKGHRRSCFKAFKNVTFHSSCRLLLNLTPVWYKLNYKTNCAASG